MPTPYEGDDAATYRVTLPADAMSARRGAHAPSSPRSARRGAWLPCQTTRL